MRPASTAYGRILSVATIARNQRLTVVVNGPTLVMRHRGRLPFLHRSTVSGGDRDDRFEAVRRPL